MALDLLGKLLVRHDSDGTVRVRLTEVETLAMKRLLGDRAYEVPISSNKSMIGHTKGCAGIAGMIKVALALHHKVLPPTLKAEKPDPLPGIEQS